MTDKVQKIKDWISKEQDGLMDAQGNFEYPEHQGAYDVLCNLDSYIDSLQEEPKPKFRKGDKVIYLNEEYVVEDITDHYILRSTRERTSVPVVHVGFGNEDYELRLVEEPISKDFEMALTEMVAKAQKCVVEPWVVAAQWKYYLIKLAKSEEPVSEQNLSNVERTLKEWKEK